MSSRNTRKRLGKPSLLRCRHCKSTSAFRLITLGFCITVISFLLTFYTTSDYLFELMEFLFTVPPKHLRKRGLYTNIIGNYEPRNYLGKSRSVRYDYYISYKDFDYQKPETLTYESRIYSNDVEIFFRFPKQTKIFALLLIFHACKHSASDWFQTVERQRIIGAAVDLGYACLVFQSTDKNSQCWSNVVDIYENKDIQMVFKGLDGFYEEYPELRSLPRFTFGSSSGGIFSSIFAINQVHDIQGQILFISIILPEILYNYVKAKHYPPTAWIHMLRDIEFASEERINISQQIFNEHKIPHKTFPIEPVTLKYSIFHDRIPSIIRETSSYLVYRLQQRNWVNFHGYLIYNPRRTFAWQSFLFPPSIPPGQTQSMYKNLNQHKKVIEDFLNTIYGEHDISYERSHEALKWLKETYMSSRNLTDGKK